jgi:hypothetical protein
MIAARIAAWLLLAAATPAFGQTPKDSKAPTPAPAAPAPEAAFDTDTYTCQDVLNDLAAGRQSQIGIAVVVTYAQIRAERMPQDHRFTMAAIQQIASAAGAACATGDHTRLLRDVVAEQTAKLQP